MIRARLVLMLAFALGGAWLGFVVGELPVFQSWTSQPTQQEYPLPHHIPKYPGGVSLRFAIVHDVIHERFPRHGEAYYQERNRACREEVKKRRSNGAGNDKDEAYFALFDDLGAGLDYLKQHDEAVRACETSFSSRKLPV
jgi:hypothetical protein